MQDMVRTRIAPSPTGENLHIGNLYTALINWAVARKNKGQFIVRIEDTDRQRLVEGSEDRILNTLRTFGLDYDEGTDIGGKYSPYRQSERLEIYNKYAEELIHKGSAYYCICTKERLAELRNSQTEEKKQTKYDKYCLKNEQEVKNKIKEGISYVVRLNVSADEVIRFHDAIRGAISFNTNEVDDQVLVKSDGFPTYHLAVVVDDHLMEITHVIRAEEWISSTPKHVLLYKAFGWDLPIFAHTPILRNPDKSKLSKRKNPVWANWYMDEGYLPEAVLNYLALMGWSHPEQKDIFTIEEFIGVFDLKDVKTVGPAFDLTKLTWMNQQYIQAKSDSELKEQIIKFYPEASKLSVQILEGLIPLLKTRMQTLKDFIKLTEIFFSYPVFDLRTDVEKSIAKELLDKFERLDSWNRTEILAIFKSILNRHGVKMPLLYYIFTGHEKGLPLPETLEILGKETVLESLNTKIG